MGARLAALRARLAGSDHAPLVLIALLPLLPLAALQARFYLDWSNHVWLVAYFGEHLRAHLTFPLEVNTSLLVGMPNALFYAYPLYAAGGALSAAVGPDLAIRALLLAVTYAQVVAVYRLVLAYGSDRALALVAAALGAWSTYALTNLYNRGALTEYVGACLLSVALASLLRVLPEPSPRGGTLLLAQAAFAFALSALIHPITGLLGGGLLLVAWLLVVAFTPRRGALLRDTLLVALPGAVALGAWGALFARVGSRLQVNGVLGEVMYFPFDNLVTRLLPFPFDDRSGLRGTVGVHTPYLDTQLNATLLLLVVALPLAVVMAGRGQGADAGAPALFGPPAARPGLARALLAVSAAGFLATLLLSLPSDLARRLPGLLRNVQFGYRFVAYQNLFLLLGLLGVTQWLAGARLPAMVRAALLAGALGAGALSLAVKLSHAAAVRSDTPGPWATPEETAALPWTFYGLNDFSTRSTRDVRGPDVFTSLAFPVSTEGFGRVGRLDLEVPRDTLVATNVLHFEDNTILVDGVPLRPERQFRAQTAVDGPPFMLDKETMLVSSTQSIGFWLSPGRHRLEYAFTPPRAWRGLFLASNAVLLLSGAALLALRLRRGAGAGGGVGR
jgi:hypothetical protein